MVSSSASTCKYSPILLTIPRSTDRPPTYVLYFFWQWFSPVYIRVLIASICDLGTCPCPRCTTPMTNVPEMGMPNDMRQRQLLVRTDDDSWWEKVLHAWELIYERSYVVNTPKIKELLRDQSLVPTTVSEDASKSALIWCTNTVMKNTFSDKLSAFGCNLFVMLVVDLLHEFELGMWKAVFMHLLHIWTASSMENYMKSIASAFTLMLAFKHKSLNGHG